MVALVVLGLMPGSLLAFTNIYSVTLSTALPPPGGTVGVTVVYCESIANNDSYFIVALEPSSTTTIQPCPLPGQHLLVDGANTIGPNPVLTSIRDDPSDPGPKQGWDAGNGATNPAPVCPASSVTQVFNVSIPVTMAIGSYNIVVGGKTSFAQCSAIDSNGNAPLSVSTSSLPPSLNISKTAIGDSAQASDLILFRIDYSAINTSPITIADAIPANTTLAGPVSGSISPGGTLVGSAITWVINNTATQPQGYVWFLTKVNAGFTSGSIINSASAASSATGSTASNAVSVQV
ncbi:MAG TPA: hypothetical protein VIJ93_11435, partial [bacterium]